MLKLIKIIFLLLCILIIINNQGYAEDELTIAMVPKSLDNPIFLDTFEAAEETAEALGINLEWVAPFNTKTKAQSRVISRLIDRHVDGIIISANNSDSLVNVINRAVNSGIPVATFDSDCPESKRLFYIGTNNYKAGLVTGNALLKILSDKQYKKECYNVVILSGDKGASNLNKRIIGFKKALKGKVSLNNIDVLYCHDNIQYSITLIEKYVQENRNLDIIFFTGGWPFYVPADALPYFQQWAANGGIAVGIDIFYSALLLQKKGLIDFLVGQDFAEMGRESVQYLVNYIKEDRVPPELINTGLNHADSENIDQLLELYKPWEVR